MLILGVLPALACVWIRMYVKEPEVWAENKKIQNTTQQQASLPLFAIFKRKYLFNTLTGCLWMAANFCVYYAIWAMLGTYLQKELGWTPAQVAVPVFWGNIITFLASAFWGAVSEKVGRRWALMIPTFISIFIAPLYLSTTDPTMFLIWFMLMICFVGGKDALNPGWLSERFPTEVRATAAGFVYHQGAVWGAFVAPVLTYFAVNQQHGLRQADAVRHGRVTDRVCHRGVSGAGNQGHADDRRAGNLREGRVPVTFLERRTLWLPGSAASDASCDCTQGITFGDVGHRPTPMPIGIGTVGCLQ